MTQKKNRNPKPIGTVEGKDLKAISVVTKRGTIRKNQSPGAGRPTKFSLELAHKIADCVRYGATLEVAAAANGCGRETIQRWLREGIEQKTPGLAEFVVLVEQAKAQFIINSLRRLSESAQGNPDKGVRPNWLADAWLLERTVPGQPYAIQRTKLEVEDVTVKETSLKIAEAQAKLLEDRRKTLHLEGEIHDVHQEDSPRQDHDEEEE